MLVRSCHSVLSALDAKKPYRPDDSSLRYDRLRMLANETMSRTTIQEALTMNLDGCTD